MQAYTLKALRMTQNREREGMLLPFGTSEAAESVTLNIDFNGSYAVPI